MVLRMKTLDLSEKSPSQITEDFLIWAVEEYETEVGIRPDEIKLTGDQCRALSRDVGQDLRMVELTPVLGNVASFWGIPVTREVVGSIGR